MKVIAEMTGLRLLEEIVNNNLSCGTMIRHKREDIALMSNPPQPVYEYYKYTAGDKKFHRCDENGKLGAKGQERFINYSTLIKVFEIVEIEEKEIFKIDLEQLEDNFRNNNFDAEEGIMFISQYINKAIDELNKIKKGK